jgi:hypothetical protein
MGWMGRDRKRVRTVILTSHQEQQQPGRKREKNKNKRMLKKKKRERDTFLLFKKKIYFLLRCCLPITSHSNWATGLVSSFLRRYTPSVCKGDFEETGGPKLFDFWVSFMPSLLFFFSSSCSIPQFKMRGEKKERKYVCPL